MLLSSNNKAISAIFEPPCFFGKIQQLYMLEGVERCTCI